LHVTFVALVAMACADPGDVLYTPPPLPPIEVAPGLFRVTFDPAPDYVRGFTPTGDTILFARHITTPPTRTEIRGLAATGGPGIEQVYIYRAALNLPFGTLVSRDSDRFVAWWQPGTDGLSYGPAGCPNQRTLPAWMYGIVRLPPHDGGALSSLPTWVVRTPTSDTLINTALLLALAVRFDFGESAAEAGGNPFGPVAALDAPQGYYVSGDTVWRIQLHDAAVPAVEIGPGIFPAVSPDGSLLAVAVPVGVDSTFVSRTTGTGLRGCRQDAWTLTTTSWTTVVTHVVGGDTVATFDGTEPRFDADGTRIVVSRPAGLVWVDLATKAATAIPNTAGASNAAVSPDGIYLAFTLVVNQNADVYFVQLK
jgi:hypothetical protein